MRRRRDCERADRAGWLIVEDGFPRVSVIGRLPNAAVVHSYIKDIRPAGNARGADRPSRAERTDHAPLHRGGKIVLCVNDDTEKEQTEKGT